MRAPAIRAVGLLSGWGQGAAAVPADAARAAAGRAVLTLERPALTPSASGARGANVSWGLRPWAPCWKMPG